ncbi:hypothetical protein KR044_006254, partial [Drosophila immigrans]
LFALLLAIGICLDSSSIAQAASTDDQDFISFKTKCNCSLTMACSCCQTAVVNAMNLTKSVCMTFKINLLKASVDVTISLDGNAVSQFTLDTKTPPSFCMPVISDLTPLAVCLKMTTKMSGLTNLTICPSFFSNFDANEILSYDFPCIKIGLDGFSLA